MHSKAYINWMINQDRVKVLIKFYPWAVREMHYMWPQTNDLYKDVFPESTLFEALFKLDSTKEPILSFGVVQLVSIFETYLSDRYAEILETRISTVSQDEIKLTEEYKLKINEFGDELSTYIAQEKEKYSQIFSWRKRLEKLLDELCKSIKAEDSEKIEEIFEIRNLLIHHGGKLTKRFINNFQDSKYINNEKIVISTSVILNMMYDLQNFVFYKIE